MGRRWPTWTVPTTQGSRCPPHQSEVRARRRGRSGRPSRPGCQEVRRLLRRARGQTTRCRSMRAPTWSRPTLLPAGSWERCERRRSRPTPPHHDTVVEFESLETLLFRDRRRRRPFVEAFDTVEAPRRLGPRIDRLVEVEAGIGGDVASAFRHHHAGAQHRPLGDESRGRRRSSRRHRPLADEVVARARPRRRTAAGRCVVPSPRPWRGAPAECGCARRCRAGERSCSGSDDRLEPVEGLGGLGRFFDTLAQERVDVGSQRHGAVDRGFVPGT